jgi:hypothetical protein
MAGSERASSASRKRVKYCGFHGTRGRCHDSENPPISLPFVFLRRAIRSGGVLCDRCRRRRQSFDTCEFATTLSDRLAVGQRSKRRAWRCSAPPGTTPRALASGHIRLVNKASNVQTQRRFRLDEPSEHHAVEDREKSDEVVVPRKRSNKGRQLPAQMPERRPSSEGTSRQAAVVGGHPVSPAGLRFCAGREHLRCSPDPPRSSSPSHREGRSCDAAQAK